MPTPLEDRVARARGIVTAALFAGRDGTRLPDPAPTLLAALVRLTPEARAARITAWMRGAGRTLDDLGIHRSWIEAARSNDGGVASGVPRASDPAWVAELRQHLRRRQAEARVWSAAVGLHPRASWLVAIPPDRLYAIATRLGVAMARSPGSGRRAELGFRGLGVVLADVPARDRHLVAERLHRDAGRELLAGAGLAGDLDVARIRSVLDDLLRRSGIPPVPDEELPPHPGRTR